MNSCFEVRYVRDGLVEECHRGILQFGFDGGDLNPYYLRSCAKPLQASLLIDHNIDFTQEELAFCSGSHAGEECHVNVAKNILKKIGLDESYLKCGIHPPLSKSMQDKMLLKGEKYSAIHNNCSGKHLGFLAICVLQGWNLGTYYEPNHPLQKEVKNRIYELCEILPDSDYPITTDGCGVPIVSMPLANLLKGYENLISGYPQIINAIIKNPYIYGGEDRLDTEIIKSASGLLVAKVGAGGLCVVYNLNLKDGFAVKIEDASMQARKAAVLEIINRIGWADINYDKQIKTLSGKVVGEISVTNLNIG